MQEQKDKFLIERLKAIAWASCHETGEPTWRGQRSYPPVTEEALMQAETQLGFVLPSLLRRIYLEVGNGGFGPGYGLLPLNTIPGKVVLGMESVVAAYQGMRAFSQKDIEKYFAEEEKKPALWPERVLILCDWGCNIYSCLDCSSSELPMFRMDSNENFLVEWALEAFSLSRWLEMWIDGAPLARLDWEQATKISVSQLGTAF